jgi:histidine triad (HIT) family protein
MLDCIFCRIASGEIPANVLARSDSALAFRDLHPQAPTHVLVIPVRHVQSTAELADADRAPVLGEIMRLAVEVAAQLGLADAGYRLVVNTGADGGQSVGHLHVHLLGGRLMGWPPG